MDSCSQTASSNLNALETLRDTLLLSEGFWAGSAVGHSSETLHGHCSVVAPLPARTRTPLLHTLTFTHIPYTSMHACTHTHTVDNTPPQPPSSQLTLKLLSLQRIQSHREIWPYRPNWIVVIPCLTCFGDV